MAGLFLSLLSLAGVKPICAQDVAPDDRPTELVPKKPTQKEADRRESLRQYGLGLQYEKEGRLVAALQAFQEAARLDPEAAPVYKAQVPIWLAMNRPKEALTAINKVVELDPADTEGWYFQSRILKALSKNNESRQALQKGLATVGAKRRPELAHQMCFDLGSLLEVDESWRQAVEAYTRAAAILDDPQHRLVLGLPAEAIQARIAEVYERLGNVLSKDKQFDQAIKAYKKAQETNPDIAGKIGFSLAQVLMQQEKFADALPAVEGYLNLKPQGMDAYRMKIKLLERLGREDQILPWLEQTSRADSFNNTLRLLLAERLVHARQLDRAEKVYLEMHAQSPEVEAYRGLFKIYKKEGKVGMEKLLRLVNTTLELANGDVPAKAGPATLQGRTMLPAVREDAELCRELTRYGLEGVDRRRDLKWQTVHFLAVIAERHRQLDEAERFFRSCLKNVDLDNANTFRVYQSLLRVLTKARKHEAAQRICQERLAKAEGQERLYYLEDLARTLARMDRYNDAMTAIDEAVKIASDNANKMQAQFVRIRILSMKGDHKQAETECQAMLKGTLLPSEMMEIHYQLSSIYSAAKQPDKSEEELQWVLRFDPSNTTANNDLGYLWADQNRNLKEAEEMIRQALDGDRRQRKNSLNLTKEEDQDNAAYVDSLGWVLFRRGDVDAARKELERAAALPDGDDPTIWDHLGDVYHRLRMYPEARNAWHKALELFERDHRRPMDDRYRDLQRKVKMAVPAP
jgi:tetratricopeptide (TPR) repeat protein